MGYEPVIDVSAIAETMRPSVTAWKNQGYCIIIDPTKTKTIRDISAGTTTSVVFPLGSGPTRIQPLKDPLVARNQTNDTTTRVVQFWLDFPKDRTIPDIRPGFEVVVTNGGNDPYLTLYQYSVTGALNSSQAWQRTINTLSNMEAAPDYRWSYFVGSVNVSGVDVLVEYESAPNVWSEYFQETAAGTDFRVPVFVGPEYRVTFSRTGYVPQTISPVAILNEDVNVGSIVLLETP